MNNKKKLEEFLEIWGKYVYYHRNISNGKLYDDKLLKMHRDICLWLVELNKLEDFDTFGINLAEAESRIKNIMLHPKGEIKDEVYLDYTQHKPYFHIRFEKYASFYSKRTETITYAIHLSWFKFNKTFFLNENEMLNTGEVAKKVV